MTSNSTLRSCAPALLRIALSAVAVAATLALPAARSRITLADHGFTLPDGFEIERVAAPPLVERPIVADFDDEGRLYVADSSGSNDKVEKQLADRPHRIVRLEDADGDGRFDTSRVFADRMMLPEGTLWFDGSLYVAAPPSIWKLTDTNGDGVADEREEWFQGKTLTTCANDLHGPYLGPDGWIYWTKGAFAQQTYERPGKAPLVTRAAHIFRRRPGDALVEPVITGGMDNPVDVAFLPSGEAIFTTTFLEHPQLGRRDALVHAVYGALFGKPHAVIDGHPRTGDLMPPIAHYGPAAPSGLAHYASRVFGDDYRDNFFAALFNLQKVTRHALEPSGGTFKSRDSDFVVSDNRDFHPTDVLEDADGSLLVVDTGAWYKLCCPSSQLAKPDVLGAIYRVRRKGAPTMQDPRGRAVGWTSLAPADLAAKLDDPRPAVRERAVQRLGALGDAAVPSLAGVLTGSATPLARLNAVWALTRMDLPRAREVARSGLADRDEGVRLATLHSISRWRDAAAAPQLVRALSSPSPAVQRLAAEALGRVGDRSSVPALLSASAGPLDRSREHAVTYALIELGDAAATAAGLRAASSRTRRTALVALDQMPGGGLQPETVVPLLDGPDRLMSDTAWWVAGHHPEWGASLARFFERALTQPRRTASSREDLEQKLAQFAGTPAIQELLATTVERAPLPDAAPTALHAMAKSRVKQLPARWVPSLVGALGSRDIAVVRAAIAAARAAPPAPDAAMPLRTALVALGSETSRPIDLRLDALAAVDGGLNPLDAGVFAWLRSCLEAAQPATVKSTAASILEHARLDRDQQRALLSAIATAGPLELPHLLGAYGQGGDEALGMELIDVLSRAGARTSVRGDALRPRLAKYPPAVQARGEVFLASLTADTAAQSKRLEELLGVLRDGDLRRGQAVFNSAKGACSTCHAIGYQGGRLGPDLTSIGQIRSERDLIEAIVFPNASFARGFEPLVVTTTTGRVVSGVLRSDLPDELVLATSDRDEARISKQTIEDMQPGTVSLMPQGLADQLTRQELADLLAFLKGTRWGA
jgi:putative membrane-bound dehydrogenase-like protein